jgi:hypothetical protein
MPMNAVWHKKHRMPAGATLEDRIEWHVAHASACACRAMPATIARAMKARDVGFSSATRRRTKTKAKRRRPATSRAKKRSA